MSVFLLLVVSVFGSVSYVNAFADADYVYLGGFPAGFSITQKGAYVAGFTGVATSSGTVYPTENTDLKVGDVILSIDGKEVNGAEDVEKALSGSSDKVEIGFTRGNERSFVEVQPVTDIGGKKRLGLFIRENVHGIGTVSFIKGNVVATLGHPVLTEQEKMLDVKSGVIYGCEITGCVKGERGDPGELRGMIDKSRVIGKDVINTPCGVFGISADGIDFNSLIKIEIGEGKMGDAEILSTVSGSVPKRYKVSIIKADGFLSQTKNYVIKVTDKELIDVTGGIVQGMSGSPIVQDGKLVGVVTHVFINDPTRGFGISIDNMLKYAE